MNTKILFVDIDGTLTETISGHAFKQHPQDVKVIEGVQSAIAYFISKGWMVIGVSNQGGIAKGFKTLAATVDEMIFTLSLIPDAGMLKLAKLFIEDGNWDVVDMIMVGDRSEDLECASAMGCKFLWADNWRKEYEGG